MQIVSIDIETTGLDPNDCSILEFGAVVFEPQPDPLDFQPRWALYETLFAHKRFLGEPYALRMNSEIIDEIQGAKETYRTILSQGDFIKAFRTFLLNHVDVNEDVGNHVKFTVAGKNYDRFDLQFLNRIKGWDTEIEPLLQRRTLDVGSLYFDPKDDKLVNLDACLEKVNIRGMVTHRALDDALAVATAVTRFFAR